MNSKSEGRANVEGGGGIVSKRTGHESETVESIDQGGGKGDHLRAQTGVWK